MKILRRDQTSGSEFDREFAELPARVRKAPYDIGQPPEAAWREFLKMPAPKPTAFWLAEHKGKSMGRIGANLSFSRPGVGYVGFFEVDLEDAGAETTALQLLETATQWLVQQGAVTIYGPVVFSTWFPYRYRIDNDPRNYAWEPINPPEYPAYFEKAGFQADMDYHSMGNDSLQGYLEATKPALEGALKHGYRFRELRKDRFLEEEVPLFYKLSMAGFTENYLFEPIPEQAFRSLYVPFAKRLDVGVSHFALDPQGREVAFAFSFFEPEHFVFKSATVLPEHRRRGLSSALLHLAGVEGKKAGRNHHVSALVKSGLRGTESISEKTPMLWKHQYRLYRWMRD